MVLAFSCVGVLLFLLPRVVQPLIQIGSIPPSWDMSRPPTLNPDGDGSAVGPGSSWRPAPRFSQKVVSEVTYPRRGVVNLDLPPRQRWKELIFQYRDELIPFDVERGEILDRHTEIDQEAWVKALEAQIPWVYLEEFRGIMEVLNHPAANWRKTLLSDALYELGSPTACSQLLMATKDGTVLHGRNLDYKLEAPIAEIIYLRNGQPSYVLPQFVGGVGLVTVIKPGQWALAQNTRIAEDDTPINTLKRLQAGANLFGILFRQLADSNLEYDEVVGKLREAVLVRSSYFVLSGAGPFQGTIISRWWDPSFRHTEDLTSIGKWYAVQTNDDNFKPPADERRDAALGAMARLNQSFVSPEAMLRIMHKEPLFVSSNVYFFLMSVKSGKFCTVLGPTTKNDDTSVDCHMDGWSDMLPVDKSAWTRWTE